MRTPWLAAGFFVIAFAGWLAAIVTLWPGHYEMNAATGAVGALADAALRGQAPGDEAGASFMATFYFPPFPLAVAAARRAGLAWKDALRATSIATAILLALAAAALAAALGGGAAGAWLGGAFLFAAYLFKASSAGGRADLLAAAFSLGALAAWVRDPEARRWSTPALAAAGFMVKATTVALPVALLAHALFRREWRTLPRFAVRFAACAAIGAALLLPARGPGWYADAVRELVTASPCTWSVLRGPAEIGRLLASYSELAVAFVLALVLLAAPGMRSGPAAFFAGASGAITGFVMMNYGAAHNHLVELAALAAACAGAWSARALAAGSPLPAFALAVLVIGGGWRDLLPLLRHARNEHNLRAGITRLVREEPGPVFTEDALLSLAAGRRPAITDPGALRSLALKGDARAMRVVAALDRGEFGLVVLLEDMAWAERWYRDFHLGEPVVAAIRRRYRPAGQVDGFHLYRPVEP